MIFHLNHDLLLASSVRATATAVGQTVQFGRQLDELAAAIAGGKLTRILIDLQTPGLDLDRLRELVSQPGVPPVVMYAQHVNESLLEYADGLASGTEMGVTVMTRGQFSRSLAELMT